MKTKDRIRCVFSAIGCDVHELVANTSRTYCPTIQPRSFPQHDRDPNLAAEMADFAAQAFDSLAIIYGQARRAFNHRNHTRAFMRYLTNAGIAHTANGRTHR